MPKKTLKQAERQLVKALKRLSPYQEIVGRRNARKDVAKRLRVVRQVVDRDFPVIRGKVRKRLSGKREDVERRFFHRMDELDYSSTLDGLDPRLMGKLAKAKIPMRVQPGTEGTVVWIPAWVFSIPHHDRTIGLLRKLAKSPTERKLYLARKALEKE